MNPFIGVRLMKKNSALFGENVPPSCSYCTYNGNLDGRPACLQGLKMDEKGQCRGYFYNPLLRKPRTAPPLNTQDYSPEDFQL